MTAAIKATWAVVTDYWQLFVNRRAYTVQSKRPHPETGRHYYFRPTKQGTDIPPMLTEEIIRQHLEGKITVGLNAINPSTQRCKWVAIDADHKNAIALVGPSFPPDQRFLTSILPSSHLTPTSAAQAVPRSGVPLQRSFHHPDDSSCTEGDSNLIRAT